MGGRSCGALGALGHVTRVPSTGGGENRSSSGRAKLNRTAGACCRQAQVQLLPSQHFIGAPAGAVSSGAAVAGAASWQPACSSAAGAAGAGVWAVDIAATAGAMAMPSATSPLAIRARTSSR